MRDRVTVLGMGRMGSRMAGRLVEAGYPVTVWNRDAAKARPLEEAGARVASTAGAAVAEASVVITMLADGPVVDEVVFRQGVADSLRAEAVLVDMSSIPPAMAREHGARLASRGIGYVDAPVSGGTVGAAEGTLAIMAGGDPEVIERVRPVLTLLGRVTHVGPAGSGQLTKLCNQVIVATSIGAVAEALLLAQAGGALPGAVVEALQGGFADSRILREHGKRMLARDWVPGGSVRHQVKDLRTALEQAQGSGLELPILNMMGDLFAGFEGEGGGGHDHSALLLELERRNAPHRVGEGPDRAPTNPA